MSRNALIGLRVRNFTAFAKLDLQFSPGINVFIGANSTGKTHLLKMLYSACDLKQTWEEKLVEVFLPYKRELGRLVSRGGSVAEINVQAEHAQISKVIRKNRKLPRISRFLGGPSEAWYDNPIQCAFIPAKEMLAESPGFLALSERRELSMEGVLVDILRQAQLPPLREKSFGRGFKGLLDKLKRAMEGEILLKGEEFFRRQNGWDLEFTLLAEGYRKLGLLWLLIQNGMIAKDSILFWDEPEANLNPGLMGKVIEVLLGLQRLGVQVFVTTHSFVVIKEFDLRMKPSDQVRFFSLFRDEGTGQIAVQSAEELALIDQNRIVDTLVDIYDRDVERALKKGGAL